MPAASKAYQQLVKHVSSYYTILESHADAAGLLGWVQDPWSYLAMGNFPYASRYLIQNTLHICMLQLCCSSVAALLQLLQVPNPNHPPQITLHIFPHFSTLCCHENSAREATT